MKDQIIEAMAIGIYEQETGVVPWRIATGVIPCRIAIEWLELEPKSAPAWIVQRSRQRATAAYDAITAAGFAIVPVDDGK